MAATPINEIATQPGMDVHPPGFFAALKLWMVLAGRSKFAMRYLSAGFSLLTVALVMRFGRHLGGIYLATWAGILVALSPFYVAYAQEVRMYAMVTFFALASVYCQWRLVRDPAIPLPSREGVLARKGLGGGRVPDDEQGAFTKSALPLHRRFISSPTLLLKKRGNRYRYYLILYILFTTASLYTHYFTVFLLAVQNLFWLGWWLSRRTPTRLLGWWGSQLAVLLLFAPQLRLALRQVTTYTNPNLSPPSLDYFAVHNWQAYTVGLTTDFVQMRLYLWTLAGILIVGLAAQVWFAFRNIPALPNREGRVSFSRQGNLLALLAWLLIPMVLYFIVLQRQPSYEPRYLMLVTPALFLLFAMVVAERRWTQFLGLVTVMIFGLGLSSYFANPAFFKDDSDSVATWLADYTTASDVVLVDVPHPFHYYADQIAAPTEYLFVDIHTAASTLNHLAQGRERLYWTTWWGSDTDPRGVIPFLLQKQAGLSRGEMQFKGYRVTWYQLSDQPFSLPNELAPIDVNFDNVLRLDRLAYSQMLTPGQIGWATLHFSQLAPMDVNYKMSLRLRAPDGQVLAQQDTLLLNDRHFQTADWPIDDPALNQAINVYALPLTDSAYTGSLTLEAVVYNAETLAAIAAYGVPTTNDDFVSAQLGQVVVR